MWSTEKCDRLQEAIEFTGDHEKYGKAMGRVINEWKYCVEQNLTNLGINRKAWIGHAAVTLETGIPEHITRQAWSHLTDEQRFLANKQADKYILQWEQKKRSGSMSGNGRAGDTRLEYQTRLPLN